MSVNSDDQILIEFVSPSNSSETKVTGKEEGEAAPLLSENVRSCMGRTWEWIQANKCRSVLIVTTIVGVVTTAVFASDCFQHDTVSCSGDDTIGLVIGASISFIGAALIGALWCRNSPSEDPCL